MMEKPQLVIFNKKEHSLWPCWRWQIMSQSLGGRYTTALTGHGVIWPINRLYRKIFQFPAVTAATVSRIKSHYRNHLKVISWHSHQA